MTRNYQYNYSELKPSVFDREGRERKAITVVRVCQDHLGREDLGDLTLLDVGSSSGVIDNYLADYFGTVYGIDIDEKGMTHAQATFQKPNLHFSIGDAMQLEHSDNSIDVAVCSHVYEHVPDARKMFAEILRVLKPGGFCYFSGNNRVILVEPHHKLPLLSVIPRFLAHPYMRITGKGEYYHEKHVSYWTLKSMCANYRLIDYSAKVIEEPKKFGVDYMLTPGSFKQRIARFIARHIKWATPHIWVLEKASDTDEKNTRATRN